MNTFIAILIASILFLSFVLPFILRRIYYKRLFTQLEKKEIDTMNQTLDSRLCKLLFRPFNREFFRLNGYLVEGNNQKIDKQFTFLLNEMQLNNKEYGSVLNKGFNYYLSQKDKRNTKKILDKMKESHFEKMILKNNQMLYDIILNKDSSYITEISELIKNISKQNGEQHDESIDSRVGVFQYLLGLQYSYKHDEINMNKYFNLALNSLKNTAFEKDIYRIQSEYQKN